MNRVRQHMAYIGVLASSTMFICVWIVIIGHGVQGEFFFASSDLGLNSPFPQDHPNGWVEGDTIKITTWAPEGTTFVQGMNVSCVQGLEAGGELGVDPARSRRHFSTSSTPGSAMHLSLRSLETSSVPRTSPRCATDVA